MPKIGEIKFRAWDKLFKEMFNVGTLSRSAVWHTSPPKANARGIPLDNIELMRYTGLKDSEVVEEYFGDIIEEDDGTRRVIEDEASVVAFRIVGGKNIKYFWDLLPHKVIGNIYENPELCRQGET